MSFQLIAITNRMLVVEPLPERIANLCAAGIDRVIVREKDLSESEYGALLHEALKKVEAATPGKRALITVNTFARVAQDAGITSVQLPLSELRSHPHLVHEFTTVGTSIHGKDEALLAEELVADYLIAGHIFPTNCKAGIAPRGLDFLHEICEVTNIPVYAIGGINEDTIALVKEAGAAGACLMSELMICDKVATTVKQLRNRVDGTACR